MASAGLCAFSPRHDLTLSRNLAGGDPTFDRRLDKRISQNLGRQPSINYVQIFENRGLMMGCSNPHPHGQIWATPPTIPNEPRKEHDALAAYQKQHGACLLCDYIKLEEASGERLVYSNEHFLAVVPFWAVWPYEILLLPKPHLASMTAFDEPERSASADILKSITSRYDGLFQVSCPYSMGFHQQPTDEAEHGEWHFHAHFFPPLLRSATIRKFMVGFEMLGSPQRDITPEYAAEKLRHVRPPTTFYLNDAQNSQCILLFWRSLRRRSCGTSYREPIGLGTIPVSRPDVVFLKTLSDEFYREPRQPRLGFG